MANSYTKIFIHYVFAVKYRQAIILPKYNERLQKYICGIVANRKSKVLAINNMPDHIHILISQHPSYSVSKMVQEIKNISSKMINEEKWFSHKFAWQRGYGAFSYASSEIENVKRYIRNQQKHHMQQSFKAEYLELLDKFDIDFDDEYLFEFFDT